VWRRWLAIVTVSGLLIAALFAAELSINRQNRNQSRHENAQEHNAANTEEPFWQRTAHDPIAVFNLLLVAFTGVLAVSTIGLWLASLRHAGHAERAIRSADRTAQRELRAYVHVHDVRISLMNSGFDPNIDIIVKNYGQTPARSLTNTFKLLPMERPREREFALDQAQTVELADLGPSQKVFSTVSLPVSVWATYKAPLVERRRTFHFHVFGRIDYQDAFGSAWWTKYRYKLLLDTQGIPDGTSLVMDGHAGNRST
jgi:hypothetical protein